MYASSGFKPLEFAREFSKALIHYPVVSMGVYLWVKAIIIDWLRIRKEEKMTMPGYVFWVYGLEFFAFWAINDIMYSPRPLGPNVMQKSLYYDNPMSMWIALDILTMPLIIPIGWAKLRSGNTEHLLIYDIIRTLITFILFIIISSLISLSSI